jgi:predicted metal-dependent phosphotriesterase family hydrolase
LIRPTPIAGGGQRVVDPTNPDCGRRVWRLTLWANQLEVAFKHRRLRSPPAQP